MPFGNHIIIDDEDYKLYGEPLNSYWEFISNKPNLGAVSSSPLNKGYFAQWILRDNKLYLSDFEGTDILYRHKYVYEDYFGEKEIDFFAFWFSGTLSVQSGEVVFRDHHFGETKKYSFIMTFEKGELVNTIMQETITKTTCD